MVVVARYPDNNIQHRDIFNNRCSRHNIFSSNTQSLELCIVATKGKIVRGMYVEYFKATVSSRVTSFTDQLTSRNN